MEFKLKIKLNSHTHTHTHTLQKEFNKLLLCTRLRSATQTWSLARPGTLLFWQSGCLSFLWKALVHLLFLVNTSLSSSLAHKALHNGSPAYLLFLSCHFPSSVLHPACLSPRRLVFSCLCAPAHIPSLVWGIFFPCRIFYYFYKRSNTRIKYCNSLVRNNCYPLGALTSMAACTCSLYFSLVLYWSWLFMDMGPLSLSYLGQKPHLFPSLFWHFLNRVWHSIDTGDWWKGG